MCAQEIKDIASADGLMLRIIHLWLGLELGITFVYLEDRGFRICRRYIGGNIFMHYSVLFKRAAVELCRYSLDLLARRHQSTIDTHGIFGKSEIESFMEEIEGIES